MVKEEKEIVEGSPKIFLTGLANDTSKSFLNTYFSKHGKVADIIYKFGADGKRIKEVAYVLFESEESVNKWLEEKTVTIDERKVEIKKTSAGEGQKEDEPLLAVPKAALKCYVCKREKFPSVEAYLNHKKGKQHQAVYKIFKAKSSSVFQLLKAEAKLAADRAYDSIWMKKNPKFNHVCDLCQCNIVCKQEKHELSVEHKMVKNYNNQKCCEINFTDRHKYEAHLLTLKHLKMTYEKDQQKTDDIDDGRPNMKKAIDLYMQCDNDLKELKENYGELDINAELPPFDSNHPIGLNYIVKKINYHCICCDQKFFAHLHLVEPHCRSYNHYTNMTDYIVGVDKKIAQKRKNEEGEVKPNKKKMLDTSDDAVMKKEVKKEVEDEDSTLNKSATVKDFNTKRKVKKEPDDDEEEEEEDEEMDTLDKSNDDEEDVDQSESKDLDEEQEGDDEEQEEEDDEQEEGDEEQEEGDEDQDEGEEVVEEEAAEDQEEVAEDSDVQEAKEEEEDEEQMQSDEEEAKVTTPPAEKNVDENPAEDTAEDKEEEEVAEESPKPTRGTPRGRRSRGRGRGRGLKR